MEASLIDMTRGLELHVPAMNPYLELEVVRDNEQGTERATEYAIAYALGSAVERAPIEDAFADPWFAVHEDALRSGEDTHGAPIATRQSLHTVVAIAVAVAVATCLLGATL